MKQISKHYRYDDDYFDSLIPAEAARVRPRLDAELPLLLKENLIDRNQCRIIINQFFAQGPNDRPTTARRTARFGTAREVYSFALEGEARDIYLAALDAVRGDIADLYEVSIVGSDGAHGLGYSVGDKYDLHADNCNPMCTENRELLSFRLDSPNRHLSSLLFLSDSVDELDGDFQHIGGNLTFPFLVDEDNESLLVEPKCGLFVAFPSDLVYSHQVHEVFAVSSQYRLTIVDWHITEPTG
jgi:hypothetical protein